MNIKLVVALGNPGREYENTRHNIAWLVVDKFLGQANWKYKFKGIYSEISLKGEKVYFLKPETYMNLSGECVQPFCQFYKISVGEMLVIQDELDLPFGQVAFKQGGGLAGHNGLKSITQHMGTQEFSRFRIGIGRPVHGSVSNYVLSPFRGDEQIAADMIIEKSAQILEETLLNGITKVATKYNKKPLINLES